jgi:hypothetical protein
MATVRIRLIDGPAALLEACGFRLLTDPTFDPPGQYQPPHTTLSKTARPALAPEAVGPIDAVLLSHDQHADNLDNSGPARHGPAGIEPYCGEVIGFVLALPNEGARPIYVTGDTVWRMAWPRWRGVLRRVWCCSLLARHRHGGPSTSP